MARPQPTKRYGAGGAITIEVLTVIMRMMQTMICTARTYLNAEKQLIFKALPGDCRIKAVLYGPDNRMHVPVQAQHRSSSCDMHSQASMPIGWMPLGIPICLPSFCDSGCSCADVLFAATIFLIPACSTHRQDNWQPGKHYMLHSALPAI